MTNPKKLLETLYGVPMQDGGKLPPGIKRATDRAKESKSVLPVAGARQARQAIQGYLGMDPSFSVMDPEAQALESAYRGGETASVLGDLFASMTPFATASALSKVNQIPGASMAVRRGRTSVPQQVNLQMAREEAEKIGQSASPYERSLQQGYGHGWFHGTTGDIEQFKKSLRGEATGAPSAKKGFFFARDPESPPQHMLDELRSSHEGALKVLKDLGVPQEKIVDDFKGMAGHGAETASGYSQLGGSRQYKEAMRKSNAALKKGSLTEYSRELEKAEDIAIGEQRYLQSLVAKVGDARDDMLDSIQKAVYSKELPQAEAEALDKKFKALMPYGWYRSYSNEQINNLKKELIDLTGKEGAESAIKKLEKYMSLRNEEDLALKTLEGSNVMPIALRYKNPLVHDFQGSSYRDITYSDLMDEAIRQGKDALILKNTYDPGASTAKLIDVGIVFEPNQIRSKFAAFDPTRINESDLLASIGALSAGAVAPEVVKQLNRANEKPSEEVDINGEPQMAAGGAVSSQNNRKVHISDNPDTMLLELMSAPRMQAGGSMDQFLGRTVPRGVSALPGYGQGKEDVQQVLTALEESPAGRIASGVGELAEGYMSGAGSTDLQKIGQGLSMIPMLGLPATVSKTIKTARVGDAITDSLRAKYPNVDISVAGDNTLYLGKMVVPKEQRNQGIGTQVMNDLVKQADDIGATVTLSPSADFGGNKEKLKEFYKRFGFVQNTGKNKDFAISESMYRAPQENLPTNFSDLGAMATQAYADYKANPNQLNALRYQRIKKAADDAYVKTQATSSKPVVTDEDYRGLHTAPTRASGAPLHALTQTYPDDIYSSRASQYYGHGEPRDAAVVSLAQSFKGRPHQMVTVYRAVPKNAKGGINAGDWVTIDRPYAKSHGESALRGDYKILSKRVRANEIFTNGDSIYEWGYDPVEAIKKAAGGAVNMQNNRKVRISDNSDTMLLELLRKKHA